MTWFLAYGTMGLLMLVGILLMIIILLQRGRGGGLAGAFGGAGGQSAFGTRAGDVFTKITAIMAIIWVFLAGVSRFALEPAATEYAQGFQTEEDLRDEENPDGSVTKPPGENGDAGENGGRPSPPPGNTNQPDNRPSLNLPDGPNNQDDASDNSTGDDSSEEGSGEDNTGQTDSSTNSGGDETDENAAETDNE